MDNQNKKQPLNNLSDIIWPIARHENKKFIPMALMMFCILLNYSTLRSIKDGFVVVNIGAEAIGFIKTYMVLPSSVIAVILYTKLYNVMSSEKVFYTITSFFIAYLVIFTFFLYPHHADLHPSIERVEELVASYRNFQWFIKIWGKWTFATLYIISELWGAMMLSLLFWQFANQITKTEEAKRFYSMFGLLANISLPVTAIILQYFLSEERKLVSQDVKFIPVLLIVIISGFILMLIYRWIVVNVLTDSSLYTPSSSAAKKKKAKLSVKESFKMIFTSRYLGLICLLILCYGTSINIVEGIWKSKIKELYPTSESYTIFMGNFQAWQGIAAILFMLIGSNILRKVSWSKAAIFTPLMILVTGTIFFALLFFKGSFVERYLTAIIGISPLAIAVLIGTIQNVLSKATKYSLFDSTKEMAYIPLDDEMKSKGKAAVDVIGGRFGKSGGGFITSSVFFLIPSMTFNAAIPFFASVFFIIVVVWLYAVRELGKEYNIKLSEEHTN